MVTEPSIDPPTAMPKDLDLLTICEIYYLEITKQGLSIERLLLPHFYSIKSLESLAMARVESPDKHSWWLSELESLGINTREESQLKDPRKTTELTMDIKQMFYEEYKKAFGEG
jgi:hypothetical protein